MGRYTSDTGAGSQPRRQILRLTASDPAVPVPEWAGIVYITGCGPGQGGANSTTAGVRGNGGYAGGYALRLPVSLDGETEIAVVIGAPSAGAAGGSNTSAPPAGVTQVVVGTRVLTLSNRAHWGAAIAVLSPVGTRPWVPNVVGNSGTSWDNPLAWGAMEGLGSISDQGYGAGGFGPFGAGGDGVSTVVADAPGADATGYGAGGAGSNGAGKAGDGAPSIIWLEFEEIV